MIETFLQVLVLLLAVNGAPVIAARIFRSHGDLPLDLGIQLRDGHPVFGASKTWRGLAAAVAMSCLLSEFFGYGSLFGAVFGTLVMAGDLCSSFVKRRRGFESGTRSVGWDQVPESLLPSIYTVFSLDIQWWWAIAFTLAFALVQMLISKPLYWLHIRKRPH